MNTTTTHGAALLLAAALLAPTAGTAQSLEQRVLATRNGTVRLSYATKPGVCGNGEHGVSVRSDREDDWEASCEEGPARVTLRMEDIGHLPRQAGSWLWRFAQEPGPVEDHRRRDLQLFQRIRRRLQMTTREVQVDRRV